VALCQARISTKPLWGFSSSNPYHSQSRAEQSVCKYVSYRNVASFELGVITNVARKREGGIREGDSGEGGIEGSFLCYSLN
jgi:hypothetical protein